MKLILIRDVTMKECPWLLRDYRRYEVVERYSKPTFGSIRENGIACQDSDGGPFFELPENAVKKKDWT